MLTRTTPVRFPLRANALAGLAATLMLAAPLSAFAQEAPSTSTTSAQAIRQIVTPDFTQIVKRYGPAVVNISVTGTRLVSAGGKDAPKGSGPEADDSDAMQSFLRKFQEQFGATGASMTVPVRGLGSGFIVSGDGLVLTNAHVVAHASEVTVKLTDRREFPARILGVDTKTDMAVLKIDAKDLPSVTLGSPSDLSVGEWVLAIGSPFGLDNTVTTGVVSAKARTLPDDYTVPFIQTDTAINPGNSGGPLFNAHGEVVGINSQIFTRSGGYQGLSFAIPIDLAQSVARQIVATGHAAHGVLGVSAQEVTQSLATALHLSKPAGALLSDVHAGSAAAKAGLQFGDVIVGIDGHAIETSSDLPLWIAMAVPGQKIRVDYLRNGKAQNTVAALEAPAAAVNAKAGSLPDSPILAPLGIAVRNLLPLEQRAADTKTGLLVDAVAEGPSTKAGIEPGDILLAINQTPLTSVEQARQLLAKEGKSVAVLVQHGGDKSYLALSLP
ncbi:DegQ Trypsin-like serine proteases, typically periplasmic, contain C-terminal PDZ domain [Comamonadaceae bacterium]